MGKIVLKDVVVRVDAVNLSARASRVTINSSRDLVDSTTFGAEYRQNEVGLGDASIDVTFQQDFDPASVDATLWPLHTAGSHFRVQISPRSGAVSPTNPTYIMEEAVLPSYTPLSGGAGDLSTVDVSFQNAGQRGIERVTS